MEYKLIFYINLINMDNTFYILIDTLKTRIEQNLSLQLRNFDNSMQNFYREYDEYKDLLYMI